MYKAGWRLCSIVSIYFPFSTNHCSCDHDNKTGLQCFHPHPEHTASADCRICADLILLSLLHTVHSAVQGHNVLHRQTEIQLRKSKICEDESDYIAFQDVTGNVATSVFFSNLLTPQNKVKLWLVWWGFYLHVNSYSPY